MRWRVRPTGSPSKSPSVVTSASPTRSVEQRYRYPPIWLKDTPSAQRFNSFVVSASELHCQLEIARDLDLLGDGGGEAELTLAERVIRLLVGLLRKLGARTPHTPFPFPHSPFPIKKRSQEASS